jgi:hypothetical protein
MGDSDSERRGREASAPATPGKDESMQKYGSTGAQKLRSTADDNLIIMLNGEMIFGKQDGEHPRPRPNVLRGGVVPHRSALVNTPAIVAEDGVREACDSLRVHDDSEGDVESRIFDQSTFGSGSQGEEIAYDHSPISPFGDASSVGRLADSDSEIEMEGSYFSSQEQPPRRQEGLRCSVLSARGMACINNLSSDDDEEEEEDTVPRRYALSTPYRSNLLQDDWVRAWGEAWGLRVNKAEQQKRTNRLNRLHAKHEQPNKSLLSLQARSPVVAPSAKQAAGPSVSAAVLQERSLAKAVAQVTGSPPPSGAKPSVKLPWGERTVMDWAQSEDVARSPRTRASPDPSMAMAMASAEKTVKKKSKWVFGDSELSEDEQDEKLGEENKDGEEAWTRSAKKQFRSVEPFRKLPAFDSNADDISKAVVLAQRKQGNPHSIRKHAMSSHEQRVMSAGDEDSIMDVVKQSFLKYTPDIAKLRLQREKLRRGDYDGEDEHRPLFRRNDGRLVRKFNATALHDMVAQPQPTSANLGHVERVGAWV